MTRRKDKNHAPPPRNPSPLGPALAASALSFLIFLPALRGAFLNWDDNLYVN